MFQGNQSLRAEGEKITYTKELIDEYIRCKEDIIYFAEHYFYITTIDHGKIKIPLWDFQKKILKAFINPPENRKHICMMMPRQQGKCLLDEVKIKIRHKKTKKIKELPIKDFFDMIIENYKKTYNNNNASIKE